MNQTPQAGGKRIYRSWIISYTIILILPLLLNLLIYTRAKRSIEAEYQNIQYTSLLNFSADAESELMILNEFASKAGSQSCIISLLEEEGRASFLADFSSGQRLKQISDTLTLAMPRNSLIGDYYIFSLKNGLIWNNSGLYELDSFQLSRSAYVHTLFELAAQSDIKSPLLLMPAQTGLDTCSVLYPLPSGANPSGYLAILVSSRSVEEMLSLCSDAVSARIYITDSEGNVCYRSRTAAEDPVEEDLLTQTGDTCGKTAWLYQLPSSSMGIKYQVISPFSTGYQSLKYLRYTLFGSLLIGLIGGGALIVIFSRRNYTPVKQLADAARALSEEEPGTAADSGENEYELILRSLQTLQSRHDTVQEVVNRQNRTIYTYYLSGLLKNSLPVWSIDEESLQAMEQEMCLSQYAVLVVMTDFDEEFLTAHSDLAQTAYASLYEPKLIDALTGALGSDYQVSTAQIYDFIVCVIGVRQPASLEWLSDIRESIQSAVKEYDESLGCRSYFACSSMHFGIEALPEAYREASELMPYALMTQEAGEVICPEDIGAESVLPSSSQADDEQLINNYLLAGDTEQLTDLLGRILDRYSGGFSFHTVKGIGCGLACRMISTVRKTNRADEEDTKALYHQLSRLVRENTPDRVRTVLFDTASLSCGIAARDVTPGRKSQLVDRIEEELSENLYNENLNIMFLAQRLNMNAKYLSSVYQEETGSNLMDVIHRRRIARFKELIATENLSVKDAAARVGYSSVVTLNRWFKKFEGITPGKLK